MTRKTPTLESRIAALESRIRKLSIEVVDNASRIATLEAHVEMLSGQVAAHQMRIRAVETCAHLAWLNSEAARIHLNEICELADVLHKKLSNVVICRDASEEKAQ